MRKTILLFAFLFSVFGAAAYAQTSDKDAARVPLENYLKGHATGDGEYMKKAFHTEGNLIFIREGKFTTRSFAEYIAGFTGKPAADEAERKRSIESVEVSGNAGVAKIVLDYPTMRFVDYMSLLKIGDEWKIVAKIFYAEPKAKPAEAKKAAVNKRDLIWKFAYLVIAGGVFLIDQTTKAWAVRRLRFGDDISVIQGFLNFAYRAKSGRRFLDARRSRRCRQVGTLDSRRRRRRSRSLFFLADAAKRRPDPRLPCRFSSLGSPATSPIACGSVSLSISSMCNSARGTIRHSTSRTWPSASARDC